MPPTPKQRAGMGEKEEGTQRAIIEALRWKGYTVLQTTVRFRRCQSCGTYPAKAHYGADPGVPDLLVTRSTWPPAVFRGMEVKSATGKLSPAQKDLAADERVVVVRSVDEALAAVERWEKEG